MIQRYYLGCPVWGNKDWVGVFFSRGARSKDFLREYASAFNAVEGNSTFYGLPPSFGPSSLADLDDYLRDLPGRYAYAVEVRHPDFFGPAERELDGLLRGHGVDRVLFDTRGIQRAQTDDPVEQEAKKKKPNLPYRVTTTGDRPFVRFVGRLKVEDNLALLSEWADVAAKWISRGLTPTLFFHTPDDFYAPHTARCFHELLSERMDVGALPNWPSECEVDPPTQMELF